VAGGGVSAALPVAVETADDADAAASTTTPGYEPACTYTLARAACTPRVTPCEMVWHGSALVRPQSAESLPVVATKIASGVTGPVVSPPSPPFGSPLAPLPPFGPLPPPGMPPL